MSAQPIERADPVGPLVTIRFDSSSHFADFPDLLLERTPTLQTMKNIIATRVAPVLIRKREKPGWYVHLTPDTGEIRDRFDKPLIAFDVLKGFNL